MTDLLCGRCRQPIIVERDANRLRLRCPTHGVLLRYYALPPAVSAALQAAGLDINDLVNQALREEEPHHDPHP
ncbi:MAG: hypothetical protein M5R40_17870 [Anaerolineae bacterium]|nr:hypothetical protein [Anaerolineae bacterium]